MRLARSAGHRVRLPAGSIVAGAVKADRMGSVHYSSRMLSDVACYLASGNGRPG